MNPLPVTNGHTIEIDTRAVLGRAQDEAKEQHALFFSLGSSQKAHSLDATLE